VRNGNSVQQVNNLKPNTIAGIQNCFICDSSITGKGISLLMGCAPYSKISLPTKIGQLMGEGFVIIVTGDDVLCRRCSSLIIRLDKLETDMDVVKKALTGYLKMKYSLYEEEENLSYQLVEQTEDEVSMQDGADSNDQSIFEALQDVDLIYSEDELNETKQEVHTLQDLDITGYKCMSCQYKTTSSAVFLQHLKTHSNEMYFKCSNCDVEFHNHVDIQAHIMSVHYTQTARPQDVNKTNKIPLTFYECNLCKFQSLVKSVFDNHVLKHNKTSVSKCSVCSKKLSLKELLKCDMNSENVQCDACSSQNVVDDVETNKTSNEQIEQQILVDSSENLDKYIQVEGDVKMDTPEIQSDDKCNYNAVEELLEQLHAENPVTNMSDIINECQSVIQETNLQEQNEQVESVSLEQYTGDSIRDKHEFQQVASDIRDASFLLENPIFEKEDDNDEISGDLDRNEGSDTNDFLNDPSSYLCNFQSESEKREENQEINNSETNVQTETSAVDEKKENVEDGSNVEVRKDDDVTTTPSKKRVYVCSVCGLETHSESHIKRHFKSHVALEKKIYECHICNKVLTTRSNLNRHLSNHENCSGPVTCNVCNEQLSDRLHLKQHLDDQHAGPQHCSFCNMEFTNKRAFKEHELTHPERAVHECNVCHERFLTQLRLKTHFENVHDSSKDGDLDGKSYKCHICSKVLTTYHNLKRHIRNHEKSSGSVKCSLCSEELTDRLHLRQHMEEMHPETHQCPFCQKVFSNKKLCKSHELTHPERFVYKCDVCEKMFLNETRLEKHKRVFHRDPHCRYCEKEIEDPIKLFNHERRHEMYKNKFPCQLCSKVFRTPSGLKYHMSVHTGKYPVYCETCGKGMHSEMILEEHKATHTKEIRYTCELCGRNFTSNSTYRMHRKWHDNPLPYKCKLCDRKFKHTSILSVHMRRAHTGERPYKCPHCPYTFSVSGTLHKHIILHTKNFPYNCKLCPKGFTTRTKLARHMAKEHNDYEMLNAKPVQCEYKMVLKPSELPTNPEEETSKEDSQELQLPETKFEESVVEEHIVDASQAIFLFQ
ncbi:hypothetical protein L9F63_021128, partial [Diploptera punctata]